MLKSRLGTRIAGAALAVLPIPLLAAACSNSTASAGPGATVPRAAPTSTTPADPYAIPSPITAAYVQRVLDAIEEINGQGFTILVRDRSLTPDAARLFRSISTADEFGQQTQILLDELDKGFPGFHSPPGPVRDTIKQLIFASSSCLFVASTRDFSALRTAYTPTNLFYFVLRRVGPQDDPNHLNPTNWVVAFLGHNSDNSVPEDTCTTIR